MPDRRPIASAYNTAHGAAHRAEGAAAEPKRSAEPLKDEAEKEMFIGLSHGPAEPPPGDDSKDTGDGALHGLDRP